MKSVVAKEEWKERGGGEGKKTKNKHNNNEKDVKVMQKRTIENVV